MMKKEVEKKKKLNICNDNKRKTPFLPQIYIIYLIINLYFLVNNKKQRLLSLH